MGYKTILLEKILDKVIDQRLMNHLTSMKIASMHRDFWMGYLTILRKDDGVQKLFLCSRWGMKFSINVLNHPPPWYPGLKMIAA